MRALVALWEEFDGIGKMLRGMRKGEEGLPIMI